MLLPLNIDGRQASCLIHVFGRIAFDLELTRDLAEEVCCDQCNEFLRVSHEQLMASVLKLMQLGLATREELVRPHDLARAT